MKYKEIYLFPFSTVDFSSPVVLLSFLRFSVHVRLRLCQRMLSVIGVMDDDAEKLCLVEVAELADAHV
jgi:hypothetical protein